MSRTQTQKVLDLLDRTGVLRPRDLEHQQIPRSSLQRLLQRGEIERVGRGLYRRPGAEVSEHHSLVEAAKRVPRGVVCLLSALRFHDLTTQDPWQVWLAIEQKAWRPRDMPVALRIVHLSPKTFTAGVEEHSIEGVSVHVYSAAKTVADCFKFRSKVGLDVALEALRDYHRRHPAGLDDLWRFAKVCRITTVIRPYLESLA